MGGYGAAGTAAAAATAATAASLELGLACDMFVERYAMLRYASDTLRYVLLLL
jgi:hypothetical protein